MSNANCIINRRPPAGYKLIEASEIFTWLANNPLAIRKLFAVLFTEFINTSSGINHTLFPGIKRMAGRTHFHKQIFCKYGTGHK